MARSESNKEKNAVDPFLESQPVVTVITVCYNSKLTIRRTLESVLHQTYSPIEYIIIDGQSGDGTIDVIKEYQEQFGERLRLISEPDRGIYDAMNKGIRIASGKVIGILNSDDYYEDDAIEKIINAWNREGMQILYGFMRTLKNGREHSVSMLSHQFLDEHMIWHPSCFVTRDIYEEIGLYDIQYRSVADYDFMLRARDSHKVKFVPVYSVITNYNEGGMSESAAGYLEGLRYRRDRGMLSNMTYRAACIYEPIRQWAQKRLWK